MIEPIIREITVPCSVNRAFDVFTLGFGNWWPREYSWSGEGMETIGIEPKVGGRCTEVGPQGFQLDWGIVLEWRPPEQLTISWHIGPDRVPHPNPEQASTIAVAFKSVAKDKTRVVLEHRDLHKHGERAQNYRDALNSEYGWPFILNKYLGCASA